MSKLKEYKFDELYTISSGISTKPTQAGHGTPFLSFSTIFNNPVLPEKLDDKMDTNVEEQEKYSVKQGDIFLTRTSETLDELAMSSVAFKDYPEATFSGFAKRLRPIQNNITYYRFMAFYLRSPYFRKIIDANASMTLRASFSEDTFSNLYIQLPDFKVQVQIGDFFWSIEKKIRNNNKISIELESLARTVYDYWFLQFDFPDEKGRPYRSSGGKMVYSEELKREIPEGWEVKRLGELFSFEKGKIPKELSAERTETLREPYITIDVANNGTPKFCCPEGLPYCNGYTIMVMDGAASGETYIGNYGVLGSTFSQLVSKRDDISDAMIYCLLKPLEGIYKSANTGSTVPHANRRYIEEMRIALPENASKISKRLNKLFKYIRNIKEENQQLSSLRDFLLPLLMNGQVTFKDEDAKV